MYRKALEQARSNSVKVNNNNNISMSIESIPNTNKKYVKADRQVIVGNNPLEWEKQVENYINEKIRNNEDVNVLTDDGTVLTITKDTAGKAKFRNDIRMADGSMRKMSDSEYAAKLRAESHIDELAQISKLKNGPVPDTKNHSFAKDGFVYRTAFFEDFDGQYYKVTMPVGQNGEINTIYNVGKLDFAQKNKSNSVRGLKGPNGNAAKNRIASNNSINQKDSSVNTQYSLDKQNDTAGKDPAFSMPGIPKGYTRLYRGLTEEFDKNYDRKKLDNVNGYESWTDSYELAKAYGNNVYYIDIPTSEIKNDVIDNDSTSEIDGDRNLIYFNDKPVGIKGKSGKEYMLYTDHDNYSNIEYKKVKNSIKSAFSMSENSAEIDKQ